MDALLQFAGRLHIMLLHAPIGLLIGLASIELLALACKRPIPRHVRAWLAWIVATSAACSVATGLLLSNEGSRHADDLSLHKWLGIATGVAALLAASLHQFRLPRWYGAVLVVTCGLIVPTGHLGASMTHGPDFLTEPFSPQQPRAATTGERAARDSRPPTFFSSRVAPILNRSCVSCHGADRQKGGLRLDSMEALRAGGRNGLVIVAGDATGSELVRRVRIELDDDDHMPPKSKPQLDESDIKVIEDWIAAGASFTSPPTDLGKDVGLINDTSHPAEPARAAAPSASDGDVLRSPSRAADEALAVIRAAFVHVEPVSRESSLLVVDASAVSRTIDDAGAQRLLGPIMEQVSELTLARTKVTDATLAMIAKMPRLRRLNLSSTAITDSGLVLLASHRTLEELIVSNCKLTDAASVSLERMPALRRVYVWKTELTPKAIDELRAKRSTLTIDAGDTAAAVALEKEPPIKLGAGTPQPPSVPSASPTDAAALATALQPVNTTCPVSGKPVVDGFAIVHKGRVIGFCCRHCLGQFLEDPAKFEANVKDANVK